MFASTVRTALQWMTPRAGRKLPAAAWEHQSFELHDIGTQRAAAVALKEPKYWAGRIDDACKEVPLRTWVIEIGIGADESGDVLFGTRLICVTRGADAPFTRSVPSFVRRLLRSGAELDQRLVVQRPTIVESRQDVDELLHLLEAKERSSDVLVFSLPENSDDPTTAAASATLVAEKLFGVAHVFVITGKASYYLTDRVGRELSVFMQAVRIYRPGFHAWLDQGERHPLFLPNRIASWANEGPAGFETWLVDRCLWETVHGLGRNDRLPAFNTVRQLAAKEERTTLKEAGGSNEELLRLFESDNDQLRSEIQEQKDVYDGLLAVAEKLRDDALHSADAAKAQALERQHRLRQLELRVAELEGNRETPIPSTFDGFEEWCQENLRGAVEVTGRAIQGVRKSDFHDPAFVYKVLMLLRDLYVPMRVDPSPERRLAYEGALQELQLEESGTGDGVKYAADSYSVQYGGTRRPLDRHLKGSNSRDRRFGFRLYFFWDDEGEVVVVGWLPSHLDNRLT
ncbi:MAG TPA: hypothetical protein VFE82_07165 [Ramlibacter sp.]|uniref:hypothetical protein n=1 Tax=Ramlibacter sp. TaxID=1917967 RepID=UPI002D2A73D1|nr:hypothetical protein [Ramlibacter sp.]HZY18245.1 hypothetical protein [Ramlibacter sp.]